MAVDDLLPFTCMKNRAHAIGELQFREVIMNLTRRDFLKVCGACTAVLGLGARFAPPPLILGKKAVPTAPAQSGGMLIDLARCIGCKRCVVACKKKNNLPLDDDPVSLSAKAFTFVEFRNISSDPAKPTIEPIKRQCMNCVDPACVSACTVGALQKQPNGPVTYDTNKCIGCRYCMYACPFGIPTFEWKNQLAVIKKCDNCADLVAAGRSPACVQACPVAALQYGKRAELLTIAKQRLEDPKIKYVKEIYGETRVGGTSMMYLSAVPFDQLGFADVPGESPAELSQEIMHLTPVVAGTVATLLTATYLFTSRREKAHTKNESRNPQSGGA